MISTSADVSGKSGKEGETGLRGDYDMGRLQNPFRGIVKQWELKLKQTFQHPLDNVRSPKMVQYSRAVACASCMRSLQNLPPRVSYTYIYIYMYKISTLSALGFRTSDSKPRI